MVDRVVEALEEFDQLAPSEGWRDYLTSGPTGLVEPTWDKIILAGYSEGANQQAYNSRIVPSLGSIYYSGGGDGERPLIALPSTDTTCDQVDMSAEDCKTRGPAAWMYPGLTPSQRRVGYSHSGENCDFTMPFTLDGIPEGEQPFHAVKDDITSLSFFDGEARLLRTDTEDGTHTSVAGVSQAMALVHTYLMCKAGGLS